VFSGEAETLYLYPASEVGRRSVASVPSVTVRGLSGCRYLRPKPLR
jgi:hypothetical protein